MATPYEELEYLSDYLPDEGESVLISRKDGALVCEACRGDGLRNGIDDAALYGLLVESNERLSLRAGAPLWATCIGTFWLLVGVFALGGLDWRSWFLVPGMGLFALWACCFWIRRRQMRLFAREILPRIEAEMAERGIGTHALIAGLRQHAELRTLLDQLVQSSGGQG